MRLHVTLNAPPFSINALHYKRSMTRTQKARQWGDAILLELQQYTDQFDKFRSAYDPFKSYIKVDILWIYPRSQFFTKSGKISATAMDLSNIEKPLIDLIFDSRFHGREVAGTEIKNLNINDAYVCELLSRKVPSDNDTYSIEADITLCSVESLGLCTG